METLDFWNSVADIYSNNDMTKHEGDEEISCIYDMIQDLNEVKLIASFGVADGCRDPILFLKYLDSKKKSLPKVICNDLSPELLKICRDRIDKEFVNVDAQYFSAPIDKLSNKIVPTDSENLVPVYAVGVYNADYIKESLELYKQNKDVIGTMFSVSMLTFDGELHEAHHQIEFDIESYAKVLDQILLLKSEPNFAAYSIRTNKNFISHYYTMASIEAICHHVFGDVANITTKCVGCRYIVVKIVKNTSEPNCLVTTINNVIGNIHNDYQIKSLQKIKTMMF